MWDGAEDCSCCSLFAPLRLRFCSLAPSPLRPRHGNFCSRNNLSKASGWLEPGVSEERPPLGLLWAHRLRGRFVWRRGWVLISFWFGLWHALLTRVKSSTFMPHLNLDIIGRMHVKNLSGQMRRSLPHFAGWSDRVAGVHGLRSGAGGSFLPRGWMVFFLAWQGCFCHWAGCGVESLMVLSFAYPAARCSAKEARGRPRMAMTGPSRAKPEWMHVVCTDPPTKGWGRIQRIYLAWENRRTDPKWTAHKEGEVIRKFGPWMDFWMLEGIRKIPVHKTWTKYVVDRDWFRVPAGTPGPDGLKACVSSLPDAAARPKSERFYREETAPGGMDIWQVSF